MKKIFLLFFTLASVMCYAQQNTPTTDRGVVINGVRWATRNVDAPGTIVAQSENSGMFYQWNRRIGWSSTDPVVSSYGATTWDRHTPIGTAWFAENDPCPQGWRVPTRAELESLSRAESTWITTRRGVSGRLFGTAPNQLFLPAAGFRHESNAARPPVGTHGTYWSSTPYGSTLAWRLLIIYSGVSNVLRNPRANGFTVRCVAE